MNLLIVDDEVSLRRTLRLTLESMSHRVVEAGTGNAALALIARDAFDLILPMSASGANPGSTCCRNCSKPPRVSG